ncbi:hypothetical protein GCM10009854_43100 [Saccharopolyspora halophila]|uniref:Secreted protein n=1 Tax=Saccharopolyspora halophila TaxID=405551 RepID=A0ABN3GSF7_9PSEU
MRTRPRGMAVAGLVTLGLLATSVPAHTAPSPADDPTLNLANFELRPNNMGDELSNRVAKLDEQLPNAGVGRILADANRTGQVGNAYDPCNDEAVGTRLDRVSDNVCFNDGDNDTRLWYPQGVTTVADAQDDKYWGDPAKNNQPVLVSWYDHTRKRGPGDADDIACEDKDEDQDPEKGVRVSFMDPHTGEYRHVLLVYPTINSYDNPSYMSVRSTQVGGDSRDDNCSLHAGGMVWYGNFLYVADTGRGFRVFDMRHIYDLGAASNGTTQDPQEIGRRSGTYYGHGYRYVMPQVASWTLTTSNAEDRCTPNAAGLKFSYAGLDRSGLDHMLAGEYCNKANDQVTRWGRVAAWPMAGAVDADGEQITDTGYRWQADVAHKLPVSNVQGAARFNDRWYLSQSHGQNNNGTLYQTAKASSSTEMLRSATSQNAAIGPEDLSHWENGRGGTNLGTMWTVAEHPTKRMVYATIPEEVAD